MAYGAARPRRGRRSRQLLLPLRRALRDERPAERLDQPDRRHRRRKPSCRAPPGM